MLWNYSLALLCVVCYMFDHVMGASKSATHHAKEKPAALMHVCVDSEVVAPPQDVKTVTDALPKFFDQFAEFQRELVHLYAVRCREKFGVFIDEYQVCVDDNGDIRPLTVDTDFTALVNGLKPEMLFKFFLLPPGSLRNAMRDKLSTMPEYASHFTLYLSEHKVLSGVPYLDALDKEQAFFQTFISAVALSDIDFRVDMVGKRRSNDTIPFLFSFVNFPDALICAIPDAVMEKVKVDTPKSLKLILLKMEIYRLVNPLPSMRKNFVSRVENLKKFIENCGLFESHEDNFKDILLKILQRNPEALLLSPQSISLPIFEDILPDIASNFLRTISEQMTKGNINLTFDSTNAELKSMFETLNVLVESEWDRIYHSRVLIDRGSFLNTYDKADEPVGEICQQYNEHVPLSSDLMERVTLPSSQLSIKSRNSPYSNSLCNPKVFFRILTEHFLEKQMIEVVCLFKSGTRCVDFTDATVKDANDLLDLLLTDKQRDIITMMLLQRNNKLWAGNESKHIEPKYKQRVLMNALFFRVGAFDCPPLRKHHGKLEALATVFFPVYTSKLRSAVCGLKGSRKIEEMFMCPFVDKGWLVEFYGNVNVQLDDPTCLLRLCDSNNKHVFRAFSEYAVDLFDISIRTASPSVKRKHCDLHGVRRQMVRLLERLNTEIAFELVKGLGVTLDLLTNVLLGDRDVVGFRFVVEISFFLLHLLDFEPAMRLAEDCGEIWELLEKYRLAQDVSIIRIERAVLERQYTNLVKIIKPIIILSPPDAADGIIRKLGGAADQWYSLIAWYRPELVYSQIGDLCPLRHSIYDMQTVRFHKLPTTSTRSAVVYVDGRPVLLPMSADHSHLMAAALPLLGTCSLSTKPPSEMATAAQLAGTSFCTKPSPQ